MCAYTILIYIDYITWFSLEPGPENLFTGVNMPAVFHSNDSREFCGRRHKQNTNRIK